MELKLPVTALKRQVLIVEDDAAFRELLGPVLEAENCEVQYAENGLQAKNLMEKNPDLFDLVLTDVRMPEMDGPTFLRSIHPQSLRTRFVVMTGFSAVIKAQQAYELGADGFLQKPFRMQELVETVHRLLSSQKILAVADLPR